MIAQPLQNRLVLYYLRKLQQRFCRITKTMIYGFAPWNGN